MVITECLNKFIVEKLYLQFLQAKDYDESHPRNIDPEDDCNFKLLTFYSR